MRVFYINDFKQEVIDELMQNHSYEESEIVAVPYNEETNENVPYVAGSWENVSKIIPILKEMGYTEMHLYYEDCGIWVLQWHNPEFDNGEWMLVTYD